ncbi:hypothetical protein K491DRAFT_712335 [Lophiostoma macrostomum CBS 122681]|uniref:Coatomer subunit epsilon n=1 Tax=Lophiostoma macrostomum CBS 122681 TaxID=1314788 RepID=A0A6A6TIF2_9PLEO|nr:hypothetical protein K491DRAFT_712335 [Lophiostoma macrostomum CBS 122681]
MSDPYSPEGELINIHTAFHAGAYQQVLDFDTSSFSPSNALPTRILKLRSQIALGQSKAVASSLSSEKTPDLVAIRLLADFESGKDVSAELGRLVEQHGQANLTVQLVGGVVFERQGETERALEVLSKHEGSLDAYVLLLYFSDIIVSFGELVLGELVYAHGNGLLIGDNSVALIVQIHLHQNRTDLAAKEAQRARKWAQDSLLVNIAESWVGMREGGEKYQSAFYVFEELATNTSTSSPSSLVAQAVSELHLSRLPEAEAALQQAVTQNPESADVLANLVVLNTLLGKKDEAAKVKAQLQAVDKAHRLLSEWAEKRSEFEKARAKYSPKFEV